MNVHMVGSCEHPVSGRQLPQDVKVFQRFWDWLHPHLQGVAGDLVEPKLISFGQFWFYQATSNISKVKIEAVLVTLVNLHILMQLTAREHFIGVCRQKNFQDSYLVNVVMNPQVP